MTEPDHVEDVPAENPADAPPPKGALRALFLIALADLLGFSVIIPLLPFWARKYEASDIQVGLLFSIYSICQLVGSPVLGAISDRVGRRPVLIVSQLGSVAGFLLLGVATMGDWAGPTLGLTLIYVSRVIDGFTGGNISIAQAYVSDVTSPADRAKGMGLIGAAFGIGFTVGPALGGLLGWIEVSLPAYAAALFCGVAAFQTWKYLPESRPRIRSIAPRRHGEHGEEKTDQIESSPCPPCLRGEADSEAEVENPEAQAILHPSRFLPILRNAPLVQMQLIFFFSMMAFVMMEATFAIFLDDLLGYAEWQVGLLFALAGVTIAIVQGRLVGKLSRRFGEWPLTIAGPLLVTAAMFLLVQVGFTPVLWLIIIAVIANATGRSLQTPALSALISHHSDPKQQGTVFGLFHMLGSLSRVIGPLIATAVYTRHPTAPYLTAGGITFAAAVWTIALRARMTGVEGAMTKPQ